MRVASKNSCVLLDGDLQDPPELIEKFVAAWREGYDVVYGGASSAKPPSSCNLRTKRFIAFSTISLTCGCPMMRVTSLLMDHRVVQAILRFPERDLFLRGVRAFAGFRQRVSTTSGRSASSESPPTVCSKNVGWAKKGILSFSNVPLNILSTLGILLLFVTLFLMGVEAGLKVVLSGYRSKGLHFRAADGRIFRVDQSLCGWHDREYVAKIFEEVKQRPLFIQRSVIRDGEIRLVAGKKGDCREWVTRAAWRPATRPPLPDLWGGRKPNLFVDANIAPTSSTSLPCLPQASGVYALASLECRQCDLLYANPAPTAEQLASLYRRRGFWQRAEAGYAAKTYGGLFRAHRSAVARSKRCAGYRNWRRRVLHELLNQNFSGVVASSPLQPPSAAPRIVSGR